MHQGTANLLSRGKSITNEIFYACLNYSSTSPHFSLLAPPLPSFTLSLFLNECVASVCEPRLRRRIWRWAACGSFLLLWVMYSRLSLVSLYGVWVDVKLEPSKKKHIKQGYGHKTKSIAKLVTYFFGVDNIWSSSSSSSWHYTPSFVLRVRSAVACRCRQRAILFQWTFQQLETHAPRIIYISPAAAQSVSQGN